METTSISKKSVGVVVRALFLVFGAIAASAAFVVACVLVRDHDEFSFVKIWLIIVAIVIMFAVGALWVIISLRGKKGS
jgi:ABC-type transport system involved in Fe-S cluster assembly fused permease/ATPase subunit